MELSYCVVNTNGRELLLTCLEAIRRTHPAGIEHEILVLDNASDDGSAEAVARAFSGGPADRPRPPRGPGREQLAAPARGRRALLPVAERGLRDPRGRRRGPARCAERRSRRRPPRGLSSSIPTASPIPCAWRLPGLGTAARPGAVPAPPAGHPGQRHPPRRRRLREVGWVQSAAMLVRREAAEEVGYLDPDFFVYSEEVDFQKRMRDAGWRILHVPAARAIHHEQLATDRSAGARRVVQFHRGRDDVHAQASLAPGRLRSPPPVGVVVRPARRRRRVHARTRARLVLAPRPPARFAPPAARGCARPPRPTTRNSRRRAGRRAVRPVRRRPGPRRGRRPRRPRGRAGRPRRTRARRRGPRRRLQAAGSRGDRGGAEHRHQARALLLVEEPDREQRRRVGEPEHGAAGEADESRGRQQGLTGADQRRRREHDQRQAPPLVRDGEQPLREGVHQHQHHHVGGRPAPAPRRRCPGMAPAPG